MKMKSLVSIILSLTIGSLYCEARANRTGDRGGGGEGGNWHSRNEWYNLVDAYFGPQNASLTILMLTGLDGVTKPALAVRAK
jgi:hypothetical protein